MIEALIIIPIISIALVFFISGLIPYALNNNLNTIYIVISTLVMIISSFLLPNSLNKMFKNSKFINNLNNHSSLCSSYISFILLFAFSICLLYNATVIEFNIIKLFIAVSIIILFCYVNYLLFSSKESVLEIIDIDKENGLYCVTFIDDKDNVIEYYTKEKLKDNTNYKVIMNVHTKWIKRVISEVIVVKG